MKKYSAYVTEKQTKQQSVITRDDYNSKKDFASDLRKNGFTVHFVALASEFDHESEKYHATCEKRATIARGAKSNINETTVTDETTATDNTNKSENPYVLLTGMTFEERKQFIARANIDHVAINNCSSIINGIETKHNNRLVCTFDRSKLVTLDKTKSELIKERANILYDNTDKENIKSLTNTIEREKKSANYRALSVFIANKRKKEKTKKSITLSQLIENVENAYKENSSDLGIHVLALSKAMTTNVLKHVYKVVPDNDFVRTMYYDVFRFNIESCGLDNISNSASDHILTGASLIYESLLNGHNIDDVISFDKPTKKAYITNSKDVKVKMKTVEMSVFKVIYNGIRKSISDNDSYNVIDNKLTYIELENVIENETVETWINTVYDVNTVYHANNIDIHEKEDLNTINDLIEEYELNKTEKRIVLYRLKVGSHVGYKALATALNMPLPTVRSSCKRMHEKVNLIKKRDVLITDVDTKTKAYSNFRLALTSDLICSDLAIQNEMCFMVNSLSESAIALGVNANIKRGTISDSMKIVELKRLATNTARVLNGLKPLPRAKFNKSDISITIKPYKVTLIKKSDIADSTTLSHDSNRKTIPIMHGINIDATKSINYHINILNLSESIRIHIKNTLENMHNNRHSLIDNLVSDIILKDIHNANKA